MGKAFDIIKQGLTEAIGHGKGTHVGAEQNLTHHWSDPLELNQ